jgi:fucose permease
VSTDPIIPEERDVRGAFVDCLLGYISAMMLSNFSQITLPLLAWYVVSNYFVFVSGYKSIYGSKREDP